MSDQPQKRTAYRGLAVVAAVPIIGFALAGLSIATNPYGSGPVGAIKRHFPVSTSDLYFIDKSHNGSESRVRCTTGPDYTEGERLIVTAANGAVMGTFPFEYTGGTGSIDPEALCAYEADISSLPSGQGTYKFTISPNQRILISCTESQLQSVALRYFERSQGGSCVDKKNLSDETVRVAPPRS